jgi:hypothetical protein
MINVLLQEKAVTDQIQSASIDQLRLDPENPRLPESVSRSQSDMLNYIAETTAIEDLMGAIAANDFFAGEPLVVVPDKENEDRFVVVEGNRRLTAVLLLRDLSLCTKPSARMREIVQNANHIPNAVPVVWRAERKDVLPYLGFRHITGVKQWEPLAKARYIKQLFDLTPGDQDPRERYLTVAREIGSRRDHIKRNLDALAVYNVIKDHDFYNIDGLDEETIKFAVLSTALADERIGAFVGISQKDDGEEEYEPLHPIINADSLKKHEIGELTDWIYRQDSKGRTRVGESRNLRYLAAVLDNPRALAAFRNNSSLKLAYQITSDIVHDFLELLYQAEAALTEAAGMVATISYDKDAHMVARRINENIKLIGKTLQDKRKPEEDEF